MKLQTIKTLAESHDLTSLRKAENAICNGEVIEIEVAGEDEGEQLTHILAAIDILERVQNEDKDLRTAIREFSLRVRNSIS